MLDLLVELARGFWSNLAEMAPYLLFGFLVAGILSVVVPPDIVERHLGRRGLWSIIKAAAFGVPLPLCSCGVIPVSASLRRHGASRGATTAFLLSTPQTGVDSILVTLSLLGPVFAVFRPIAALITGVLGGTLVSLFDPKDDGGAEPAPACSEACCSGEGPSNPVLRMLSYAFLTLPRDLGKALVIGLIFAGLIAVVIPPSLVQSVGTGFLGMVVMMAIGLPVYVCATASVPIAAALVAAGASPGAALVFLMTGPATNAASLAVMWKMLGRRTTIVYLATVAASALACGAALDWVFASTGVAAVEHVHEMLPQWVKVASAVALLGVLAVALLWRPRRGAAPAAEGEAIELAIEGMNCSHCVEAVRRALAECPGVQAARVDLAARRAAVDGTGLEAERLVHAVEAIGYKAHPAEPPQT